MSIGFNRRKPVVRGRASIISSTLVVRVKWKRQLERIIAFLVANNYRFNWEPGDYGDSSSEYTLTIDEIIWAENLTEISKILEKCDYQTSNGL